jgi:transposase
MRTQEELARLRERAAALRREGLSVREIKAALGPIGNRTLHALLQGVPPPAWTLRPNAKDEPHEAARQLRTEGLDYEEIAASLGVAKSSVSLWVRDLPPTARSS